MFRPPFGDRQVTGQSRVSIRVVSLSCRHSVAGQFFGTISEVPAPFTYELCGYRPQANRPDLPPDKPNMSDAGGAGSVELSRAFLKALGVPSDKIAEANETAGEKLEIKVVEHLRELRPDLVIKRGRRVLEFAQYAHLAVLPDLEKRFRDLVGDFGPDVLKLTELIEGVGLGSAQAGIHKQLNKLSAGVDRMRSDVAELVLQTPSESLLKLDITVAIPHEGEQDELAIALSSKWTFRTDRAQDPVSQGNKLVAQRRGRMPHFGVITVEPRPTMLRILADGSGAIDYIYHLDVPALAEAIADFDSGRPEGRKQGTAFNKLIAQKRLQDYDHLVAELMRVPST